MNKQIKNALDKLFKVIPYTPTPENELAIVGILQGLQNKPVLNLQKLADHDNTLSIITAFNMDTFEELHIKDLIDIDDAIEEFNLVTVADHEIEPYAPVTLINPSIGTVLVYSTKDVPIILSLVSVQTANLNSLV